MPAVQLDRTGERWAFIVPATLRRSKQVILESHYHGGTDEAVFGIKLELHRHCAGR